MQTVNSDNSEDIGTCDKRSGEISSKGKVSKAGAGYIIGNYLLKGITFLSAPIFTRLLTTADFGLYSTYISYVSIFYIIIGFSLHVSTNNAKYKYKEDLYRYLSSIIVIMLVSTCFWTILGNIFFGWFEGWFGFDRVVFNCLLFHCLGDALLQVFNSEVSLNYKVKSYLKISAFNALLNMGLSIMLIITLFSEERYIGRIIGSFIPMGLIGLYIMFYFFKKAAPRFNKDYWSFGLRYSIPIIPHGISQVILNQFDRIMIKNMVSADAAGIYSFSYTLNSLVFITYTSLDKVWRPWAYEKMNKKDYESVKKQATVYALGMAIFTVMVMMAAPEIIKILGDRAYWDSTACTIPVILGGFFTFIATIPSLVGYYYGKTGFIAIGSAGAAILNIILNYIFIPMFGYIAAAYTTFATYLVYFIFHYIIAAKVQGFVIFDTKKIFGIAFGVCYLGACALLLEKQWYIRWVLEILIGGSAFLWANHSFDLINLIKKKLHKQ